MISYNTFSTHNDYVDDVVALISKYEGHIAKAKDIGDGAATIGYGYTFNRSNNLALWENAGIDLTASEKATLTKIDQASGSSSKTSIALTEFTRSITLSEAKELLKQTYTAYESPANNLGMLESMEKAALVSITYNRGISAVNNKMVEFFDAINDSNRAEAWYQIRYNAQTTNPQFQSGIANRRYSESEHFGLYKSHGVMTISTKEEAHQAAEMYTAHRDSILLYESLYKPSIAATSNAEPSIQDIYNELQPAIEYLKGEYGVASSFVIEEVQIVPETSTGFFSYNLNGDGTAYDSAKNDQDLLIGNSANNTLDGGIGNDALVGLAGEDTLIGGEGNDILIGGINIDTLTGGNGDDTFFINTGEGVDTVTDIDDGDRVNFDGKVIIGKATNLESGKYKLLGFALSKQGNDLFITSDGNASGITMKGFFKNYDDSKDYTFAGITIPAEKHDTDDNVERIPTNNGRLSPIALDLNGDGIKYIAYNSNGYNAHFDIDNDGFAEGMEWLDKNDGFLAIDKNDNGKIDNQKEMFGDDSGTTAYAKLALLDTNNNSKIDSGDTGFATLKIWQDLDSDGKTDVGELKTLAESGITSLSLQTSTATYLNYHPIAGTSTFTRTNGTVGSAADVLFDTRQIDSIYVGSDTSVAPALDLSTLFMPLSRGYGTLPALHYAMTQNAVLKNMVANLSNLDVGTQMQQVYDKINAILLEWAGATNIAPTGADNDKNAAKLAVLQRVADSDISNIKIDDSYGIFFNNIATKLLAQGILHSVFTAADYDYGADKITAGSYEIPGQTYAEILARAKSFAPTNQLDKQIYWNEILRIFQHHMNGFDQAEVEAAAGFKLYIPTIIGTVGDDILTDFGSSVFQGRAGNDTYHISGKPTLIYNTGDGSDTIIHNAGVSLSATIAFGLGISINSLTFQSNAGGLVINVQGGGLIKTVDINDIGKLQFSDGSYKTQPDINYIVWKGLGTSNNDILYGDATNNVMQGMDGNDTIYGLEGNDTIEGGNGNDTIYGDRLYVNAGDDKINGGNGNDIIYGDSGIDNIDGGADNDTVDYRYSISGVNVNLSITTAQTGGYAQGDIMTNIENVIGSDYDDMFVGNANPNRFNINHNGDGSSSGIDTVSYANSNAGVTVLLELGYSNKQISGGYADGDILYSISNLIGSSYNDILIGDDNDNLLNGGAGNDKLYGNTGDDSLTGGAGSDVFAINKSPNSTGIITDFNVTAVGETINLLGFSNPVDFAHLNFTQSGNDTIINLEENQKIILKNVVSSTLKAANFDSSGIISGTDAVDLIVGTSGDDIIKALLGDDKIIGSAGTDKIDGGGGIDTVDYNYSPDSVVVDLSLATAQIGGDADGDILSNIENIVGTRYNDTIIGNSANNLLIGGDGADKIDGGAGIDTISYIDSDGSVSINLQNATQGWADAAGDTLYNIENIIGSNYYDWLIGNSGNNVINGFDGDDQINGSAGADIVDGGAGIDEVDYSTSTDGVIVDIASSAAQSGGDAEGDILSNIENITGTSFDDILKGNDLANSISAGGGNDTIYGRGGDDVISGNDGNNTYYGDAGNDALYGGVGDDLLIGGSGADYLSGYVGIDTASYVDSNAAINVNLGITTAQSGGDSAGDILIGIENIIGSAYNDTFTGSSVANKIDGGAGIDTMSYSNSTAAVTVNLGVTTAQSGGYATDDTLFNIENIIGSAYNDTFISSTIANKIDGGAGADTVSYTASTAAVSINLGVNAAQSGGDAAGDTLFNIENIIGSAYNDTLTGNSLANTITGGAGADIIEGAAGVDTVSYADSTAAVNINLGITTAQSGGYAAGDTLFNIENIIGSKYNDTLTGNSIANSIDGGSGTDTVSYYNSAAAVTVNLGITTSQSGGDANGDILSNIENITGSAFTDILTGNTGNNIIIGGAGADTLDGSTGIDTVSYASSAVAVTVNLGVTTAQSGGDAQGDTLFNIESIIGSAYNDTLIGSSVANKIDGGSGTDTVSYINSTAAVNVNLGVTTVQSGGYAAGDTLVSIENIIGSNYNDTLKGSTGNNLIIGGIGADKIDGSTGTDTVSYASSAAAVTVNLGVTTAQSGGDAQGDTLVSIESIIGSAYNDTLTGSSVANKIDGSTGIDTVSYSNSTSAVTVNLAATAAQVGGYAAGDTLVSIENIIGSSYNDTLTGSSVANIMTGGAGADKMDGAAGVDTVSYAGSNAAVTVNLGVTTAQTGGHATGDTLFNIENIIGSSYGDTLLGNSLANIISGGAGKDTITGGSGADVFKYSAIADSGVASTTRDLIKDFVRGTDKIDLADFAGTFTFKGTGAFTGTAHEVNYAQVSGNTIIGIDVDGNKTLDLQIELTGIHALTSSDFLL